MPRRYRDLFAGHDKQLTGHEGWDAGALACARDMSRLLAAPLYSSRTTRLLIDLNRSEHHRALFSDITRSLSSTEKRQVVVRHYHPYRDRVERWIASRIGSGDTVLHISVHSFTPVLRGVVRRADVGLLYDPRRPLETRLARTWQQHLKHAAMPLRVRRNYPYRGVSDGFTRHLRRRFTTDNYAGMELEINQSLLAGATHRRRMLTNALVMALRDSVAEKP